MTWSEAEFLPQHTTCLQSRYRETTRITPDSHFSGTLQPPGLQTSGGLKALGFVLHMGAMFTAFGKQLGSS